jgi:hypothetical protein
MKLMKFYPCDIKTKNDDTDKNRFKNRKGRVALQHLSMMVKVIN